MIDQREFMRRLRAATWEPIRSAPASPPRPDAADAVELANLRDLLRALPRSASAIRAMDLSPGTRERLLAKTAEDVERVTARIAELEIGREP